MAEVEVVPIRSEIVARKMNKRKQKQSQKHSDAGKKAWDTIRKNNKRSEASKKAWETRRAKQGKTKPSQEPLTEAERKRKRSDASKKAWETRRAKQKQKNVRQKHSEELIGALEYEGHYHHYCIDRNGNMVLPRGRKKNYYSLEEMGYILEWGGE
jgi:predicted phage gp36 major capsid-like protein